MVSITSCHGDAMATVRSSKASVAALRSWTESIVVQADAGAIPPTTIGSSGRSRAGAEQLFGCEPVDRRADVVFDQAALASDPSTRAVTASSIEVGTRSAAQMRAALRFRTWARTGDGVVEDKGIVERDGQHVRSDHHRIFTWQGIPHGFYLQRSMVAYTCRMVENNREAARFTISRRKAIGGFAVGTAAAWAAPSIISLDAAGAASMVPLSPVGWRAAEASSRPATP